MSNRKIDTFQRLIGNPYRAIPSLASIFLRKNEIFFVVAAVAVFDNERGRGKKKKKKSGPVQMTRINGKSWRIKKLEKFFNRFPPLSRWNPPLLIFDSQENQYQYEICFCSILLLRGLIRSKASWKVCRVCNHNIYRSQTSLASKYFSPNEIQRSPVKRSCYSLGWQRAYEKLKLLNRGRRYLENERV